MAHPYIFESNFEQGTAGEWDSETDVEGALDFPHYSTLAKIPYPAATPYRGAYCARWALLGDTADHILVEGDIDIADGATRYFRWYMCVLPDIHNTTATDTFNIFELQQAGGTIESSVSFKYTASSDLLEIGIGDGIVGSSFVPFPIGRWVCVELASLIHTTDAGTLTLYLDGNEKIALTELDNAAAVGQGVLGTQDTLATTLGTILIDDFVMDDARLYPQASRFPYVLNVTKSGHIFVGPGDLAGAAILTTTADNQVNFWDTDQANTNEQEGYKFELDIDTHTSFEGPMHFERGCYVQLTGTAPRVQVTLVNGSDIPTVVGPIHYSQAGIRARGLNWRPKVIKSV